MDCQLLDWGVNYWWQQSNITNFCIINYLIVNYWIEVSTIMGNNLTLPTIMDCQLLDCQLLDCQLLDCQLLDWGVSSLGGPVLATIWSTAADPAAATCSCPTISIHSLQMYLSRLPKVFFPDFPMNLSRLPNIFTHIADCQMYFST